MALALLFKFLFLTPEIYSLKKSGGTDFSGRSAKEGQTIV